MKQYLLLLLLLISILINNILAIKDSSSSDSSDDYYIGAVLEYAPLPFNYKEHETPINYVLSNVKQYSQYAQTAKAEGAQIIVFPEYGLLGSAFATRDDVLPYLENIPDPLDYSTPIIPCNNDDFNNRTILQSLSCIAIQNSIVMVVDMGDVQPCNNDTTPNCPSDGRLQYNTQVAFSQNGQLLAKYHKSHLYGEPFFNPSIPADPRTFSTDFGVTFGMFICFDILFQEPQQTLIQKYGIKNLVYSTEWVNVNYAYARGIQESWSKIYGANVLAANIGSTSAISGSGIYSNGNYINSYQNPTTKPANKLLIGKLPKDPSKQTNENQVDQQSSTTTTERTKTINSFQNTQHELEMIRLLSPTSINATVVPFLVKANQINQTITSSNNGFTCRFTYSTGSDISSNGALYSLVSFNGDFNNFFNSQLCSTAICATNDPETCFDNVFSSSSTFESVYIDGDFDSDYHIVPTLTTYPLIDNYLESYKLGQTFISIPDINQYFIGISLFGIQWNDTSSSSSDSNGNIFNFSI